MHVPNAHTATRTQFSRPSMRHFTYDHRLMKTVLVKISCNRNYSIGLCYSHQHTQQTHTHNVRVRSSSIEAVRMKREITPKTTLVEWKSNWTVRLIAWQCYRNANICIRCALVIVVAADAATAAAATAVAANVSPNLRTRARSRTNACMFSGVGWTNRQFA